MKPDCVRIWPNVALPTVLRRSGDLHGVGDVQHFEADLARARLPPKRNRPWWPTKSQLLRCGVRTSGSVRGSVPSVDDGRRDRVDRPCRSVERSRLPAARCARRGCRRFQASPVPGFARCIADARSTDRWCWRSHENGKPLSNEMIDEIVQSPRMRGADAALQPTSCPHRTAARRSARSRSCAARRAGRSRTRLRGCRRPACLGRVQLEKKLVSPNWLSFRRL